MRSETLQAYAKLNLTLDILAKRSDGYHELAMVMQSVTLADTLCLTENDSGTISCACALPNIPTDEKNLAVKAAKLFFESVGRSCPGLRIELEKHIPAAAGMAGGSSDAAAVLRCLKHWYAPEMADTALNTLALRVGSDVPYCLKGCTALAEGRGEILHELAPLPECHIVICKPDFPISTAELFGAVKLSALTHHPNTKGMIDALNANDIFSVSEKLYNVFEDILPKKYGEVFSIKQSLLDFGALNAAMSGSGPTVFGIFKDKVQAENAANALKKRYTQTFLAHPILSADV